MRGGGGEGEGRGNVEELLKLLVPKASRWCCFEVMV